MTKSKNAGSLWVKLTMSADVAQRNADTIKAYTGRDVAEFCLVQGDRFNAVQRLDLVLQNLDPRQCQLLKSMIVLLFDPDVQGTLYAENPDG